MSQKEIQVRCPCCESSILVDVLTQTVLRWEPAEGKPKSEGWDSALGRVENRLHDGVDKFDASLKREQNRTRDLDDLFRDAKERVDRRKEDGDENGDEDSPS